MRHRPFTISIIAGLTAFLAIMVLGGWLPFFWEPPPFYLLSDSKFLSARNADDITFYIAIRSYEPVLIVSAIVVAFYTSKGKIWTHKTNIVLQIITIAVFLGFATYVALMAGFGTNTDGIRESEAKLAFVVPSSIILYLLFRPEVRSYYRALAKTAP